MKISQYAANHWNEMKQERQKLWLNINYRCANAKPPVTEAGLQPTEIYNSLSCPKKPQWKDGTWNRRGAVKQHITNMSMFKHFSAIWLSWIFQNGRQMMCNTDDMRFSAMGFSWRWKWKKKLDLSQDILSYKRQNGWDAIMFSVGKCSV